MTRNLQRVVAAALSLAFAFSPAFAGTGALLDEDAAADAGRFVGESRGAGLAGGAQPVAVPGNAGDASRIHRALKGLTKISLRVAKVPGPSLKDGAGAPPRSVGSSVNSWNLKHPVLSVLIPTAMGAAIGVGVTGTPLGALIGLIGGTAAVIKVLVLKHLAKRQAR